MSLNFHLADIAGLIWYNLQSLIITLARICWGPCGYALRCWNSWASGIFLLTPGLRNSEFFTNIQKLTMQVSARSCRRPWDLSMTDELVMDLAHWHTDHPNLLEPGFWKVQNLVTGDQFAAGPSPWQICHSKGPIGWFWLRLATPCHDESAQNSTRFIKIFYQSQTQQGSSQQGVWSTLHLPNLGNVLNKFSTDGINISHVPGSCRTSMNSMHFTTCAECYASWQTYVKVSDTYSEGGTHEETLRPQSKTKVMNKRRGDKVTIRQIVDS